MTRHYQFLTHVFPAELESIRARRRAVHAKRKAVQGADEYEGGTSDYTGTEELPPVPSTKHRLVGLSLSGGGIRSAVFNLGVLQGLQRSGILQHVDYLSTVSGGGYIGGAWSALARHATSSFPFLGKQTADPPAVRHLRSKANYLMPGGSLDGVRLGMVILRGILLNLLLILPYTILLSVLTSLLFWPLLLDSSGNEVIDLDVTKMFVVSRWLVPAYVLFLLLSPIITRLLARTDGPGKPGGLRRRGRFEQCVAYGALLSAVCVSVELLPGVVNVSRLWLEGERPDITVGFTSAVTLAAGFLLRTSPSEARIAQRIGLAVVGILGPLTHLALFVLFSTLLIYKFLDPMYFFEIAWATVGLLLLYYNELFVNVNEHSGHQFWRDRLSSTFLISMDAEGRLEPVDSLALSELAEPGSDAPYHLLNTTNNLQGERERVNQGRFSDFFIFSKHFIGGPSAGYIPTRIIEQLHPHLNLGTAMAISSAAAAPNMGAFTASSLTATMTLLNIRMGAWIAHPERLVQQLVTKFGLDPKASGSEHWRMPRWAWGWRWQARPVYLFREILGKMDNTQNLINVSDGGHLENLGAYELLRRRCRYVIVSDAEADPMMQFGSLAALLRYARVDLGIEIDIQLDDLRLPVPGAPGWQHCAIGTIRYPAEGDLPAEQGLLLYIKASVTGDESSMVGQYRAASPSFPHESTSDQFFNEAQFESYRELGEHIARSVFDEATPSGAPAREGDPELSSVQLAEVFRKLRIRLAVHSRVATPEQSRLRIQVGDIVGSRGPEDAFEYYSELFPEVDEGATSPSERLLTDPVYRRRILDTVGNQLAVMEAVYVNLGLHQAGSRTLQASTGWTNLFRRWSSAPSFRWASVLHAATLGPSFLLFCQDALRMAWTLHWRLVNVDDPAWVGRRPPAGSLALIGSVVVAGELVRPLHDLAFVGIHDDGETLRLGPHALRHGFEKDEVYRLVLRQLCELRQGDDPLLPADRMFIVDERDLILPHRNDVDVVEIAMELAGPTRRSDASAPTWTPAVAGTTSGPVSQSPTAVAEA